MSGRKGGKKPEGGRLYRELVSSSQRAGPTGSGASQMSKPAAGPSKLISGRLTKPSAGRLKSTDSRSIEEAADPTTTTGGGIRQDGTAGPSTSIGGIRRPLPRPIHSKKPEKTILRQPAPAASSSSIEHDQLPLTKSKKIVTKQTVPTHS